MGICHSDQKKKKKNNFFGLTSKLDKKLNSILDKEYGVEDHDDSNYMKNLEEITNNQIVNSLDISNLEPQRSQSMMRPVPRSSKLKKPRIKRQKKVIKEQKNPENTQPSPKYQQKAIILKKVPNKNKNNVTKVENPKNEMLNSPGINAEYYELLDNLDKSNNLVAENLDVEIMNEEFLQLKEFVDKKLELLSKKEHQLNLLKKGIKTHYSKESNTDLELNIIAKKIEKKLERVSTKTENLNNLNGNLTKFMFMSNTQSNTNSMLKIQKTLDQITQRDPEINQFQRNFSRKNSGILSPNIQFLQKNMRKHSSMVSPSLLFLKPAWSNHASPMLLKDLANGMRIDSAALKNKVDKKIEKVDLDNQMLEFLSERMKICKEEDEDKITELLTEVNTKIIGKLKKFRLEDLDKEGGLDDSQGVVVWSDNDNE